MGGCEDEVKRRGRKKGGRKTAKGKKKTKGERGSRGEMRKWDKRREENEKERSK